MRTRFRFLLPLLLLASLASADVPAITMSLTPRIGSAPQDVHVKLHIPPNARNRVACIVADSGDAYSSQCWDHVGTSAPITTDVWLKQLPAGQWVVTAGVVDLEGKQRTTSETVCIVGLDSSCGAGEN